MLKVSRVLLAVAIVAVAVQGLWGAPSLPVYKPPVGPIPSWTGPWQDPHAIQGQWFQNVRTGQEEFRPFEFHDNRIPDEQEPWGGGGWASTNAIYGFATNVVYQGPAGGPGIPGVDPIVAFDIKAFITNDTPAYGPWREGGNSHEEYVEILREQYVGTLFNTKLTASFAVADKFPDNWVPPYTENFPYIVAQNHQQLAWYCWNPEGGFPPGNYFVPTWDFGDIAQGATATRLLSFVVPGGLQPGAVDPRYNEILESEIEQSDLLFNRTTSLKVSDWIDTLTRDMGTAYSEHGMNNSDVSVFHDVPEPGTVALALGAGLLGLCLFARRRLKKA